MQNIISANQKSVTESEATKDAMIPFYSSSKALPELGIQFQKVSPFITFGGAPQNNSIIWKLPPGAGFLYEASIGIIFTGATAAGEYGNDIGLNCVGQIDWLSNGQPILTQTGAALKAIVKTLPPAQQAFIYRYCKPLDPTTEEVANAVVASYSTYIPLISSWLTETQKCLLLNVVGDLQLRLTFAPNSLMGMTAPTAVTESILYVQTYMPKLSVYNQMVLNDWSKTLVMECFNTYTEVVSTLTSTTTVSNYTITCPFLVYRTHIFVQNTNSVAAAPMYEINTVSVTIGGIPLIDNFKKSRLLSMKARNGISNFSTTTTGVVGSEVTVLNVDPSPIVTIDWGTMSTRDRNTGTAFFQELRGSLISVTFSAAPATNQAAMYVVHEYLNNVAFNPGSGGNYGILSVFSNN